MPAYNCANYIEESINAILNQSFTDFEFIIINDGSKDNTKESILKFNDDRIKYFENETNLGIVKTLNRGLKIAIGTYILRTDADDIAVDTMIERLFNFMTSNPDYIVCGGFMKLLGGNFIFKYPSNNEELKIHTLNACPFSHSTVLFKNSVIRNCQIEYDINVQDGEDHALWSKLLLLGKFKNLEEVTLFYRESNTQITAKKDYIKNYDKVRDKIFEYHAKHYFSLDESEVKLYCKLIVNRKIFSIEELIQIGKILKKIILYNSNNGLFNDSLLKQFIFIKWHFLCLNSYHLGSRVFNIYLEHMQGNNLISRISSTTKHFFKKIKFK